MRCPPLRSMLSARPVERIGVIFLTSTNTSCFCWSSRALVGHPKPLPDRVHDDAHDVRETALPCPSPLTDDEKATKAGFAKGSLDDCPAATRHRGDCVDAERADSVTLHREHDAQRCSYGRCDVIKGPFHWCFEATFRERLFVHR